MGIIYFAVILASCILGAIVGLGGGVFLRPIFDAIGYHDVISIGFFASFAIFSMAVVSTTKKIKDGTKIHSEIAIPIALGAIAGGVLGNLLLEYLLEITARQTHVQYIQIVATIKVLVTSLILTAKSTLRLELSSKVLIFALGIALGIVAAFLGIGGGPLNVPMFMIFFGLGIKDATTYSIAVILLTHFLRLVTLGITVGFLHFDLAVLPFVIVAASLGGLIGAKLSKTFSEKTVRRLFQGSLCLVILMNLVNGLFIL